MPSLSRAGKQIERIQLLPQLIGELVADGPGVFPGQRDAGSDAVRIPRVVGEVADDLLATGIVVEFAEGLFVAGAEDDRLPETTEALAVEFFVIQQELLVHIDQAGKVIGPLHIADHPVKGVCDTG
mgnify:CR=1 FL=1